MNTLARNAAFVMLLSALAGCLNLTGHTAADAGDATTEATTDITGAGDADVSTTADVADVTDTLDAPDANDISEDIVDAPAVDITEVADVPGDAVDAADEGTDASDVSDVPVDVCALTLCGAACVDTQTDARNCGACGRICAAAHGTAACVAGACAVAMCDANFADCDMSAANGCEVDTRTDAAHCGVCGNVCMAPVGSVAACVMGRCEAMSTCPAGQAFCGAACQVVGASCVEGMGACARSGTTACVSDAVRCSATAGMSSTEVCDNLDNDCDGVVDDGLMRSCYTGPLGTSGMGACRAGTQTCSAGSWGTACSGEVLPATEVCDGIDNDCDGLIDEGFCRISGVCFTDGQANPANACQRCAAPPSVSGAGAWSNIAVGTVCRPSMGLCDPPETCPGSGMQCPADTLASAGTVCRPVAGACDAQETCTGSTAICPLDIFLPALVVCRVSTSVAACDPPETCTGTGVACPADLVIRTPTAEICDGVDNNCNGAVDETPAVTSCPARSNATATCGAGVCGAACNAGFADCDGVASNGCEASLASDRDNCGTCGHVCPLGGPCVGGICTGQLSCPTPSELGCGMVTVIGGTFTMGQTSASLATPTMPGISVGNFALDAYEVTVARFRRFWAAGHPGVAGSVVPYPEGVALPWTGAVDEPPDNAAFPRANWSPAPGSREGHPINGITWYTAQAFCVWDGGRLPTEAETEFAARTSVGLTYPWGDGAPDSLTCWSGGMPRTATCPVGSFPATRGFYDLSGNVNEWVADNYENYGFGCWSGAFRTRNPLCATNPTGGRSKRGGCWLDTSESFVQGASRSFDLPLRPDSDHGMRCARSR